MLSTVLIRWQFICSPQFFALCPTLQTWPRFFSCSANHETTCTFSSPARLMVVLRGGYEPRRSATSAALYLRSTPTQRGSFHHCAMLVVVAFRAASTGHSPHLRSKRARSSADGILRWWNSVPRIEIRFEREWCGRELSDASSRDRVIN